jgi:hypothetical protein
VRLKEGTVWMTQKQMTELFGKNVMTINEHIKNVYKEGELERSATIRKFLIVQKEGKEVIFTHFIPLLIYLFLIRKLFIVAFIFTLGSIKTQNKITRKITKKPTTRSSHLSKRSTKYFFCYVFFT